MSETARLVIAAASEGLDAAIQKLEKLPGAAAKAATATSTLASKTNAAAKQMVTSEKEKADAARKAEIAMLDQRRETAAMTLAQAKLTKTTTASALARQQATNMETKAALNVARASHGVKSAAAVAAAATHEAARASLEAARASDVRANAALRAAQADSAAAAEALRAAQMQNNAAHNLRDAGLTMGQQTANMTNMAAQFQDIGVTAAMGMNPMMIALQQGTQMSMVFSETIGRGGGLAGGLKILGAGFLSLINPISLFIMGLVGAIAAGVQMVDWTALWNNSLKWLQENIVVVTRALVYFGVVAAVAFAPAAVRLFISLVISLTKAVWSAVTAMVAFALANPWTAFIILTAAALAAVVIFRDAFIQLVGKDVAGVIYDTGDRIVAVFVGSYHAATEIWNNFPAIFTDIMVLAINGAINLWNDFFAAIEDKMNRLKHDMGNEWHFLTTGEQGTPYISNMWVNRKNRHNIPLLPSSGAAQRVGDTFVSTGNAAYQKRYFSRGVDAAQPMMDQWSGQLAGLLGGLSITPEAKKAAKGGDDPAKTKKHKEQITEAMKFGNMMKEGNLRIAQLERETKALGLLGVEAKKAAIISDMLNKAEQEGIKVDYRRKLMIEQKAQAIAQAEQFKEDRAFYWEQKRAYEDEAANLQQQTALIGLNGEAAARAAAAHKVWNYERQNNTKIGMVEQDKILNDAARVAQEQARYDAKKYHYDSVTQHNEQMRNLRAERDALGLNGEARAVVAEGQRILNWETEKGIKLNPFHRAQLLQNAAAFYRLNEETRLMAKNLEFVKDTSSDFFRDLFDDIREGENIWKAFGNTVLNVLNKIIDRLFDANLDTLFGQNSGSGGLFGSISKFLTGLTGGNNYASTLSGSSGLNTSGVLSAIGAAAFPSANGNVFQGGKAAMFATGGTFTNGVVSRPTAFDMGVMGEAGPEAIMPLRRGPDGSLGVQMHGGKASGVTEVKVEVTNIHQLTGAISSNDIVQLNRQSAEQTVNVVKQQVGDWLRQQQMDGTA